MVVTFCNGKGGAGKTTVALLLGCALADAGRRVGLIDRDPQRTATRWIESTKPAAFETAVDGSQYEAVIIDTPPRVESPLVHESLRQADKVILVSSPSPADLWSSQDTVQVIQQHHPKQKAAILFNQVQRQTVLARDLDVLAGRIGLPGLRNHVARRQVYQHALLLGWKALDAPAREEILQVALEIVTF
ncbi:MAG: ParA family protein [Verrucomicrobia bacterium]|nr:ParA family protein [Verrucomicrobiota bacterium]